MEKEKLISMEEIKLDDICVMEEAIQASGGYCGIKCYGGSTCGLWCNE